MDDKVLAKVPGGGQQNRAGRHVLREGQGYWTVLSGSQEATVLFSTAPRGGEAEGGAGLCYWEPMAGGGMAQSCQWRVRLGIGNVSLPRGVETLKRLSRELPREVVGAPCLLVFKELGQYTQ